MRWKVWSHPALVGLGEIDCWATEQGFYLLRYARRTGVLVRVLFTPWPPGLEAQGEALYDALEELMKRLPKPGQGRPVQPHADGTELLERWPVLASWFTDPAYDDGSSRSAGWVGITCRDDVFVGLMKDSTEGLQITVAAKTPLALLDAMEHALTCPEAPWRLDLGKGEPKPRRKK